MLENDLIKCYKIKYNTEIKKAYAEIAVLGNLPRTNMNKVQY